MKIVWKCLALAGAFAASACSSMPEMPAMPALPAIPFFTPEASTETVAADVPAAPAAVELTVRERVSLAMNLLGDGKEAEAKAELQQALAKSPRDTTAQLLLRQIESDPVALLGAANEAYVVQAGDTMSGLADRFLGDGLMFYALSRYNGLTAPKALAVGRTLKMPSSLKPSAIAALTALPEAAKPVVAKVADPAKANAVRLEALQLLNTGDVKRAVALLEQAVSLDETDSAIKRDLERAQRIQSALEAG